MKGAKYCLIFSTCCLSFICCPLLVATTATISRTVIVSSQQLEELSTLLVPLTLLLKKMNAKNPVISTWALRVFQSKNLDILGLYLGFAAIVLLNRSKKII